MPNKSNLCFLQPVDGDILNRHDGAQSAEGLTIVVVGCAPEGVAVTVNGAVMRRDGERFYGSVTLSERENTLCARTNQAECRIAVLWDRDSLPRYRFSIDDNIQFLKDLALHAGQYRSLFDNWYLAFWREMHHRYGARIQFNVYYATDTRDFNLSQMPECYRAEWRDNADWMRLTFHAYGDQPDRPYTRASYGTLELDFLLVTNEVERFAGPELHSPFTTIHWGEATVEGCRALRDHGMRGFVGYFDFHNERPLVSYYLDREQINHLHGRDYWRDTREDLLFVKHDLICNAVPLDGIVPHLDGVAADPHRAEVLELMVHEQYFCPFLHYYQPDVQQRVERAISWVTERGYRPVFYEEGFLGA